MVSPSPRPAREPIFNLPSVVLASILVLVGIQLLRELVLSDIADLEFILDWAVVPARWAVAFGGARPEDILAAAAGSSGSGEPGFQLEVARYILAEGAAKEVNEIFRKQGGASSDLLNAGDFGGSPVNLVVTGHNLQEGRWKHPFPSLSTGEATRGKKTLYFDVYKRDEKLACAAQRSHHHHLDRVRMPKPESGSTKPNMQR